MERYLPYDRSILAADCLSIALDEGLPLTDHDREMTRRAVEIGWGLSFRKETGQYFLEAVCG